MIDTIIMCILRNWNKGEVYRLFTLFWSEYTYILQNKLHLYTLIRDVHKRVYVLPIHIFLMKLIGDQFFMETLEMIISLFICLNMTVYLNRSKLPKKHRIYYNQFSAPHAHFSI